MRIVAAVVAGFDMRARAHTLASLNERSERNHHLHEKEYKRQHSSRRVSSMWWASGRSWHVLGEYAGLGRNARKEASYGRCR
jgi:hypothetical protein